MLILEFLFFCIPIKPMAEFPKSSLLPESIQSKSSLPNQKNTTESSPPFIEENMTIDNEKKDISKDAPVYQRTQQSPKCIEDDMTINNEKEDISKHVPISYKNLMKNIGLLPENCLETKERSKRKQFTPVYYKVDDNEEEEQDDDEQVSEYDNYPMRYYQRKKAERMQKSSLTSLDLNIKENVVKKDDRKEMKKAVKKKRRKKVKKALQKEKNKEVKNSLKKEALKKNKKEVIKRISKHKPMKSKEEQLAYYSQWKNKLQVTQSDEHLKIDNDYYYEEVNSFDGIDWDHKFIMKNAQAVLVSPPWYYCRSTDPLSSPDKTKEFDFNTFKAMNIPFDKLDNGMIFIWTIKEDLENMMLYMTNFFKGIRHVETFAWVQLKPPKEDKSNVIKICLSPSEIIHDDNQPIDSSDKNPQKEMVDSQVMKAEGECHVQAEDESHVQADDESHVQADDECNVQAEDKSHVQAEDKSHVQAEGESHVQAEGESHVQAENKNSLFYTDTDIFNKRSLPNTVFSSSSLLLLIFKKDKKEEHLELRHQRTEDCVIDYINEDDPNYTPRDFIYSMIETMLPESKSLEGKSLKRIEIFSTKNAKREGWAHINYLPSNYK